MTQLEHLAQRWAEAFENNDTMGCFYSERNNLRYAEDVLKLKKDFIFMA